MAQVLRLLLPSSFENTQEGRDVYVRATHRRKLKPDTGRSTSQLGVKTQETRQKQRRRNVRYYATWQSYEACILPLFTFRFVVEYFLAFLEQVGRRSSIHPSISNCSRLTTVLLVRLRWCVIGYASFSPFVLAGIGNRPVETNALPGLEA